jgi:RNA polymerase sigma-70 factor (ECF subfamily)
VVTSPSPSLQADWTLAQRCVAGDRAAQRELFDEQRERVHYVLFRILGSNRDMEDLIQEAFVAIFRSLSSYRGEALLATWVDRISARVAFRHRSLHPPAARLELVRAEPAADAPSAERDLQSREAVRRLYALLDRLQPKYRIAYALHVLDERSIREVAALTEVSLVAAKNRVWRARRMVEKAARADAVLRDFMSSLAREAS